MNEKKEFYHGVVMSMAFLACIVYLRGLLQMVVGIEGVPIEVFPVGMGGGIIVLGYLYVRRITSMPEVNQGMLLLILFPTIISAIIVSIFIFVLQTVFGGYVDLSTDLFPYIFTSSMGGKLLFAGMNLVLYFKFPSFRFFLWGAISFLFFDAILSLIMTVPYYLILYKGMSPIDLLFPTIIVIALFVFLYLKFTGKGLVISVIEGFFFFIILGVFLFIGSIFEFIVLFGWDTALEEKLEALKLLYPTLLLMSLLVGKIILYYRYHSLQEPQSIL